MQTNKQTDFANQGDTISRQAAIDALAKILSDREGGNTTWWKPVAESELMPLPSAQPDHSGDVNGKVDLIDRQAAIDAFTHKWDGMVTSVFDVINSLPSAQPDLDSAYTEGYTAAESKYRKMWDEMQANIKEKAFGKRKGLVHTADIDAMPTIEPDTCEGCEWEFAFGYGECHMCSRHYVMRGEPMRLIDADALIAEYDRVHVGEPGNARKLIENAPTVKQDNELELMCEELKAHIEYLRRQNDSMKGEIKALTFAVRCGGISGSEVTYETD